MDSRLIYEYHGKELTKSPCVLECAGCEKQFKPVPSEGHTYCLAFISPAAKWEGLNFEGKPKTCNFMYVLKPEKDKKINPIKASRRGIKSSVATAVAAATGSKESRKKKIERRDSR